MLTSINRQILGLLDLLGVLFNDKFSLHRADFVFGLPLDRLQVSFHLRYTVLINRPTTICVYFSERGERRTISTSRWS